MVEYNPIGPKILSIIPWSSIILIIRKIPRHCKKSGGLSYNHFLLVAPSKYMGAIRFGVVVCFFGTGDEVILFFFLTYSPGNVTIVAIFSSPCVGMILSLEKREATTLDLMVFSRYWSLTSETTLKLFRKKDIIAQAHHS